MQKNILWESETYHSLEKCIFKTTKDGAEVESVIIGFYNEIIYQVEYSIKTNKDWETVFFEIKTNLSGLIQSFSFKKNDHGDTLTTDESVRCFHECIDVDISLTPFTNSLPINRLHLEQDERQKINVLYIDVLNQQIKPVQQNYTRLSKFEYKYENVPNDFESIITVDECGLVINYPGLFKRISKN